SAGHRRSRRPRRPHPRGAAGILRRHRRPHGPRGAGRDGETHRREASGESAMSFWAPLAFLFPPAVVAVAVSACVWIALRLGSSTLERLTSAAQARVYVTA